MYFEQENTKVIYFFLHQKVGCDWVLDSDAVEDKCGVCKGGGAGCTSVVGEFTNTGLKSKDQRIFVIKEMVEE